MPFKNNKNNIYLHASRYRMMYELYNVPSNKQKQLQLIEKIIYIKCTVFNSHLVYYTWRLI